MKSAEYMAAHPVTVSESTIVAPIPQPLAEDKVILREDVVEPKVTTKKKADVKEDITEEK